MKIKTFLIQAGLSITRGMKEKEIDNRVNKFVEKNNVEIVNIKVSDFGSDICIVLVYKEK